MSQIVAAGKKRDWKGKGGKEERQKRGGRWTSIFSLLAKTGLNNRLARIPAKKWEKTRQW